MRLVRLLHEARFVAHVFHAGAILVLLGILFSSCSLFNLMKTDCEAADPICHPELLLFYQPARVPRFLYVTYSNGTMAGYAIDRNSGALNQVVAPFGMGNGINYVMVDPSGGYLYAVYSNNLNSDILGYRIGYGGELYSLPGFPVTGPVASTSSNTMTPDGRFQYYGDNTPLGISGAAAAVAGYSRGSDGFLSPAGSPFGTGCSPTQMTVDAQGRFLYVTSVSSSIYGFQINPSSGVATALSPAFISPGYTPTALSSDPSGNILLAVNSAIAQSFSIGSAGGLVYQNQYTMPTTIVGLKRGYAGGNIVYATTPNTDDKIYTLSVDATTGVIGQVSASPFGLGNGTGVVIPDPTGRLVFVGANNSPTTTGGFVNVLSVGPNGSVSPMPGSPLSTASAPTSMGVSVQPE